MRKAFISSMRRLHMIHLSHVHSPRFPIFYRSSWLLIFLQVVWVQRMVMETNTKGNLNVSRSSRSFHEYGKSRKGVLTVITSGKSFQKPEWKGRKSPGIPGGRMGGWGMKSISPGESGSHILPLESDSSTNITAAARAECVRLVCVINARVCRSYHRSHIDLFCGPDYRRA